MDRMLTPKDHSNAALELAGIGYLHVSLDGRSVAMNRILRDWIGDAAGPDTLAGLEAVLDEPDRASLNRVLAEAAAGQKARTGITLRPSAAEAMGLSVGAYALPDDEGTVLLLERQQSSEKLPVGLFGAALEHLPAEVTQRLAQILNRVVAFVGVVTLDGVLLEANEPALLAANLTRDDVIGKPFWDCYWWSHDPAIQARLRDAVRRAALGETVRYDSEIRVGETARMIIDFQLAPLMDAKGRVIELIASGVDVTERARGEAARELLLHELSHRVKNTLANVQSIASHTMRGTDDLDTFKLAFQGRLNAVAACHDLLVKADHASVPLRDLVSSQLSPFVGARAGSLHLDGPDLIITGAAAHPLSMVLHELATNAAKYGALSAAEGKLEIAWHREDTGGIRLLWRESGGPKVEAPARRGFGTVLIERSLGHAFGATTEFTFEPEGVCAAFYMPDIEARAAT